jgi:hypothetical protein
MKRTFAELMLVVGLMAAASGAAAQTPPTPDEKARERAQALQDAEPTVTQPETTPVAKPAAAPVATAPAAAPKAKAPPAERAAKAQDRLDLETTQITGNRELPKVMVVVPWKRSDIGDLAGRPVNSLVDEALQPVDREVFRREIDYYGALAPDRPRDETHVTAGAADQRPEK